MEKDRIRNELEAGVTEGVYTGAALVVGFQGTAVFSEQAGRCSLDPGDLPVKGETIFDLGSLTKPLVTTLALMDLVDQGRCALDQPLEELLPGEKSLGDKASIPLRSFLAHTAGLPDWKPYYRGLGPGPWSACKGQVRRWILEEPAIYPPGSGCVYSDLGFMLLEWVVEAQVGRSLAEVVESRFFEPLGLERTFLYQRDRNPRFREESFAATERCAWRGRVLRGEVHDENAFAMGGYSGHAGLFGTAGDVFAMAGVLREHALGLRSDLFRPATVRTFFRRQQDIPGCGRALGWDMPSSKGSAAGRFFSPISVGHLGFPGTSLWMDLEKDVQVVLLTNRIHPTRENLRIRAFRPRLHDAVMETLALACA